MRAMLLVLCFLTAGCSATSRQLAVVPELARIPESQKAACAEPVALPDTTTSTGAAARLWAKDREALGECRSRHSALVMSVNALEGQGQ